MDSYADRMTARGPTLAPDRETWTGSMHVVDLADAAAAADFWAAEPYQQAGLYAEHTVRAFTNLLGRTMWEHPGGRGKPRFLVLATTAGGDPVPELAERLLVHGTLAPAGRLLATEAPDRATLDGWLAASEIAGATVHDWEPGGRR